MTQLSLYGYPDGTDFGFLGNLPALERLDLGRTADGARLGVRGGLRRLASEAPGIAHLGFLYVRPIDEVGEIARFAALEFLSIRYCEVEDLTPLATVGGLRTLQIVTPVDSGRLAQIARMPQLTTLEILSNVEDRRNIDLSGLGDAQLTVRAHADRHRIVGAGPRIKVKWL